MKIAKKLFNNIVNCRGLQTNRKILVIESDDWGSIRMPSADVYKHLCNSDIKVENCPYSRYDSLESTDELEDLFAVLNSYRDKNNNPAIFTLNYIVGNPDFEKIRANELQCYHLETINKTYQRLVGNTKIFSTLEMGLKEKVINLQFHGREHLNVNMYMDLLQSNKCVKKAFDLNFFALSFANSSDITMPYLASFMPYKNDKFHEILNDGVTIFKNIFQYKPQSFIAPVYIWNKSIEETLFNEGIKSIQGLYFHNIYKDYRIKPDKRYRFLHVKNKLGQVQLVRNCFFEPSTVTNYDWINECIHEVNTAFIWKRPAIISSHRLNYIGSIDKKNQSKNLKLLNELLNIIIKKWPDVEFMSSADLAKLYI